ncbi:hypothetical protein Mgra_00007816 [Meloidogyne graminicola]|uniref:WD_REPEATS_REGION domain-containing protein n=1 Tax=Meloidogyne graminicola TaxID=189291 RepID=A0A8S9ZHH7_9BILA|nr:hypothetical protein Mgra_00007816 [Meloidogyne graminicola]
MVKQTACATGAEDGILKIWDLRCSSGYLFISIPQILGNVLNHSAVSGSYDDHFRLFDWRNFNKPLSTLKANFVNGGVWEIMFSIVHKQANSTLRLVKVWKSNNSSDLCYGAKAIPFIENELDEEMKENVL